MHTNHPPLSRGSLETRVTTLPTPDASALDIDTAEDVFGSVPTSMGPEVTRSMMEADHPPSEDDIASLVILSAAPEESPMEARPSPPQDQELPQLSPPVEPRDARALALRRLLQPPAQERDSPYALLPPYQPPGPVEAAAANHMCPNDGHFPSVVLPMHRALEGISVEQINGVMASPNDFLVIVFFLGGRTHFSTHKDILLTTQAKLREVFQDDGITVLASVRAEGASAPPSKFSPPISHFVTGLKPWVRAFLLAYKTIGISDVIAFHVLALEDKAVSWTIGIYKTPILDKEAAPALIRDTIMLAIFDDISFHRIIAPTKPLNTRMDIYTADVLNTIMVHALSGYKSDIQGKAYVVSLAPFTDISPTFEEAKKYIRTKTFWQGAFMITPTSSSVQGQKLGELVTCGLCKMDTHHSFACPFNALKGWWGPKWMPKESVEGMKSEQGTSSYSRGRGNRGRGHRGRGPRGQRGRF